MKTKASKIRSAMVILAGNFLYACTVRFFVMPGNFVTGGVTGMSLALGSLTGSMVSGFAMIINIFFWVAGLILLGKKFAASTLLSTVSFPVFLGFLEKYTGDLALTEDRLLCVVMGGLLTGAALGIVMKEESSSGGVDVIPLVLNKYFRFPVSVGMYIVDFLIVAAQFAVFPPDNIFYGILYILIYSVVLDKVLVIGVEKIQLKIVSSQWEAITKIIQTKADRGVTLISSMGGYSREDSFMVLSVVSNRQMAKIEKWIHEADPQALIIVSRVSEVRGRGFTTEKIYK